MIGVHEIVSHYALPCDEFVWKYFFFISQSPLVLNRIDCVAVRLQTITHTEDKMRTYAKNRSFSS